MQERAKVSSMDLKAHMNNLRKNDTDSFPSFLCSVQHRKKEIRNYA